MVGGSDQRVGLLLCQGPAARHLLVVVPPSREGMTRITWLGHAGFLIESKGSRIVIDAWRDGPTWPGTKLEDIDFVLVTHGHFDHASSAPSICDETGASLVSNFEIGMWAQQNGVPAEKIVGMNKGGTYEEKGWTFTLVPAEHSSGCPGEGNAIVPGGEACGFVIETPDGDVLYHAGDTCAFLDMQLIAELYRPTLAMLPIGDHFTMGPKGAAKAVELLGVEHVVPMHYGTFPALRGTPDELRERVGPSIAIHAPEPGGTLDLDPLLLEA